MPTNSAPQDVNSPAYKNAATKRQEAALAIVRDLAGGTPRMRDRGAAYLPMEAGESSTAHQVRLSRSLLFNTFVKVREGLIGMALKRNPDLQDDVPSQLKQHWEDIDLAGNHGDVFIKELFRDVINDGHAHVLVDMQKLPTRSLTSLSPTPTALDDQVTGRRPYWVKYRKDEAINWKSDRVNGEQVLTQVTLVERATESDGEFGEKEITRYRVLTLPVVQPKTDITPAVYGQMTITVYEEREKEMVPVDGPLPTTLARIPLVTIYSRRKAFMESDPPLLDLAYLNIGHWQQWSDLNCILRMLVPILHVKGDLLGGSLPVGGPMLADGTQQPVKINLGPGAIAQTDKEGDVNYKGADPSATEATRQALMDLEQRMSAVGLSIIAAKEDKEVTLGEKVMDQDERMSELASWLRALKDGIEALFKIHAVNYMGLPEGGSIVLGFDELDPEAVTAIDSPKGVPAASAVINGGVQ